MKNTMSAARTLVQLLDSGSLQPDNRFTSALKLAHELTTDQHNLDEVYNAAAVLIRHLQDEQLHETTQFQVTRLEQAIEKLKR